MATSPDNFFNQFDAGTELNADPVDASEANAFDQFDDAQPPATAPPPANPSIGGAWNTALKGATGMAEDVVAGYGGLALGGNVDEAVGITGVIKDTIPDVEQTPEGAEFNQWIGNVVKEAYRDYMPDAVKPYAEKFIQELSTGGEQVYQRGMENADILAERGFDTMSSAVRSATPAVATAVGAIPTALEAVPAGLAPRLLGRAGAKLQQAGSPEKREIAAQLKRQPLEGDYLPGGTDSEVAINEVVDEWMAPPEADAEFAGYTTSTAPYKLSPSGKVIDNPRYKIAQEAGLSDGLFGVIEKANPATRARYLEMIRARERLYENPEKSGAYDPSIVTGKSLGDRLQIVKDTNKKSGKAIDNYVKNNLGKVEINPKPLMDEVAEKWAERGIKLDPETGDLDFGELELSQSGEKTIRDLFTRLKEDVTGQPTGKTIHNLKRTLDDEINYGKQMTGLDAKTQGLLKDFRESSRSFLENQFPEYARANKEYSRTIDLLNRVQKAAGKSADLDGDYTFSNLGRMSRAIMSQRISRDEIALILEDLNGLAADYGRKFDDNLEGQVYFANNLDDMFGSSRQTGFSGQSQQGTAAALAEAGIDTASGGLGITAKAKALLQKKKMDDKQKFKALKELLNK